MDLPETSSGVVVGIELAWLKGGACGRGAATPTRAGLAAGLTQLAPFDDAPAEYVATFDR